MFSMRQFLRKQHALISGGEWTDNPRVLLQYCDQLVKDAAFRETMHAQKRQYGTVIIECGNPGCKEQFIPSPFQRSALRRGCRIYHHGTCKRIMSGKHRPQGR